MVFNETLRCESKRMLDPNGALLGGHHLHRIGYFVIVDVGVIPTYLGSFTLSRPFAYGFEEWKAMRPYDDWKIDPTDMDFLHPKHITLPETYFLGADGE